MVLSKAVKVSFLQKDRARTVPFLEKNMGSADKSEGICLKAVLKVVPILKVVLTKSFLKVVLRDS